MSWEVHQQAEKIADGWYAELEALRKRNGAFGRENVRLRKELDAAMHDLSIFSARIVELNVENTKLRELLDFALPIAMYAASTEEGDRIRELMREVTP